MSAQPAISEYDQLSTSEQILRLQDLWDRIAEHPEQVEVTDAQREELDRRLAAHKKSPDDTETWENVRDGLRKTK